MRTSLASRPATGTSTAWIRELVRFDEPGQRIAQARRGRSSGIFVHESMCSKLAFTAGVALVVAGCSLIRSYDDSVGNPDGGALQGSDGSGPGPRAQLRRCFGAPPACAGARH